MDYNEDPTLPNGKHAARSLKVKGMIRARAANKNFISIRGTEISLYRCACGLPYKCRPVQRDFYNADALLPSDGF